MRESLFRWIAGIVCLFLLILPSLIPPSMVEDSAKETAMLPPCDVESGIPFVQEDQVTCYWGMSEEILTLPGIIDSLDVDISISWSQQGTWIGIAEASAAEKCTQKDGYYQCDKNSVELVAGGELSGNAFTWSAVSGDYRFVAGGDDPVENPESLRQFDVDWEYQATLDVSSWAYFVFAFLLAGYAILGVKGIMRLIRMVLPAEKVAE
jgi:hypothetical protein